MVHVEKPSSRAEEARKEEKHVQDTWGGKMLHGFSRSHQWVLSSTIHQVPQVCNWAEHRFTCSSPARKPYGKSGISPMGASRRQIHRMAVH